MLASRTFSALWCRSTPLVASNGTAAAACVVAQPQQQQQRLLAQKAGDVDLAYLFRGRQGKYARVLFDNALEENNLEEVRDDLVKLKDLLSRNVQFKQIFHRIAADDLPVGPEVSVLVESLREQKAMKLLPQIASMFQQATKAQLAETSVTLTLAYEPDEREQGQINDSLKRLLPKAKRISVVTKVDESIGAGCVLAVDSSVLDLSARSIMQRWQTSVRADLEKHFDDKFKEVNAKLEPQHGHGHSNANFLSSLESHADTVQAAQP